MTYIRESTVENNLVKKVKAAGGTAYKFTSPGRKAVPDRLVLLPGGRVVFVECKAPGELPRADQVREHNRLRALGFKVVVLDSKDLEGIL
ncbi:VRR-NUC domain-containing protein [Serratia sp. JSRIV002]|jgi:Holliday junction resolvase|uniref:VRR-NUC domain-containing protein n=1 Tax=Serratia TaxID=613 RepID=UPI001CBF093E|nr:VRR-NUC domain-containing protein [Serratia sp. JSRIV002]UAN49184.1 VRR-NUC domain-containing protein [Serratia sp. JSRIV002]